MIDETGRFQHPNDGTSLFQTTERLSIMQATIWWLRSALTYVIGDDLGSQPNLYRAKIKEWLEVLYTDFSFINSENRYAFLLMTFFTG